MKTYTLQGYIVQRVSKEGECELVRDGDFWEESPSIPESVLVTLPIEDAVRILGKRVQFILQVFGDETIKA